MHREMDSQNSKGLLGDTFRYSAHCNSTVTVVTVTVPELLMVLHRDRGRITKQSSVCVTHKIFCWGCFEPGPRKQLPPLPPVTPLLMRPRPGQASRCVRRQMASDDDNDDRSFVLCRWNQGLSAPRDMTTMSRTPWRPTIIPLFTHLTGHRPVTQVRDTGFSFNAQWDSSVKI